MNEKPYSCKTRISKVFYSEKGPISSGKTQCDVTSFQKARLLYPIKFSKFLLLGGFNYLLNIFLVWLGTDIIGFYYLCSTGVAYFIITITNFFWNSSYIFKVPRNKSVLFKYVVTLCFFYFLHLGFVKMLTDGLRIYYLLSVIISLGIMFLSKFFVFGRFVFVHHENITD